MNSQRGFIGTLERLQVQRRPARSVGLLATLIARLRRWRQLARQRRDLAMLNADMLKDLGLSRADIMVESERPFWDDPQDD